MNFIISTKNDSYYFVKDDDNYNAILFWEKNGDLAPTQNQIDLVERLFKRDRYLRDLFTSSTEIGG